ncbi:acetylglutamate kinase [Halobacillus sp. Marseille-Q1614]|uniref:acetylglutamate kinase n=1 Tax=Halobacillus sp. Marseille-Q1614 TaxID=2709134 RepID=UPI00156DF36F|nr:acetylglutamate kinase [Halobacillus sp. Marseille-Q1614]
MTTSKSMQATGHKPVIVVKIGGSMIDQLTDHFYKSLAALTDRYHCVVVHGGGPAITALLKNLQIEGEFYNGLRKTTPETLEVVKMTLGGKVSAQVTSALCKHGVAALGLKGSDGGLLKAGLVDEEKLGLVGDIEQVNTSLIHQLLNSGYLPVIAPLAVTVDGETVNVNADNAAAAVADALQAEKLMFVTDVPGILNGEHIIERITPPEIHSLMESGVIYGGMIPKVNSAIEALSAKLKEVLVVSGEQSLLQDGVIKGTTIYHELKEGAVR